jgi:hypothetical protein
MAFRALSQVRATVAAALIADYNTVAAASAAHFGIDPALLAVDFSSDAGQFYQADIDPAQLEDSAPAAFPFLMLYVEGAADTDAMWKPGPLSLRGDVNVAVDLHISVTGTRYLAQLEDISDAALETLIEVLGNGNRPWAGGRVQATKDPVIMAGEDWIKTVRLRLSIATEG